MPQICEEVVTSKGIGLNQQHSKYVGLPPEFSGCMLDYLTGCLVASNMLPALNYEYLVSSRQSLNHSGIIDDFLSCSDQIL